MPALRLSRELGPATEHRLDRDAAQQIWEALQLNPEDFIAGRLQLQEANANAAAAMQQAQSARAEIVQLQAKLQHAQDTRWQHPAVYGAGAALVGLGWLWLIERKKRMAAQQQAAHLLTNSSSEFAVSEGPWSPSEPAEATQVSLLPQISAPAATAISDPIANHITPADLLPYTAPEKAATVFEAPTPWWKWRSRKPAKSAFLSQGLNSAASDNSPLIQSTDDDLDAYEGSTELEDMYAPDVAPDDVAQASVEILSQTRLRPVSSEAPIDHLLEIRMAVRSLTMLGHPLAALHLLARHIDAVPNTCAWAYMEYLDLSSVLGQRDAFETMRNRYRLQFNRLAPYWMEPNGSVQRLESYERPMAELCAMWPSLERTKVLIATWLLGTLHSRRLFQRPAYHDLFDLYEMLQQIEEPPVAQQDFEHTVNLLDLDYEFAVEVKIKPETGDDVLRAVPTVKTGDFDVDFNLTQGATEMGALAPVPDTPTAARPL